MMELNFETSSWAIAETYIWERPVLVYHPLLTGGYGVKKRPVVDLSYDVKDEFQLWDTVANQREASSLSSRRPI